MINKIIMSLITIVCLCILLAGCVTSVDESLPYDQLPEITIATEVRLAASSSHPTSYLPFDPIADGEQVQVIGTDKNAAWLLVLHKDQLGWMPSIFARNNVGTLKPAVEFEPLAEGCTTYVDAKFEAAQPWQSTVDGALLLLGSIYRPQTQQAFAAATLSLTIEGEGYVTQSDYLHVPLTSARSLVFFAYALDGIGKGSQLRFDLQEAGAEPLIFQTLFFSNACSAKGNLLPVGKPKLLVTTPLTAAHEAVIHTPQIAANPPTVTPTPVVIAVEKGVTAPHSQYEIGFTQCADDNCDIYLWNSKSKTARPLIDDPADDGGIAWSPDGTQFVFHSNRSGIWQLYIYDMATRRTIKQITDSSNNSYSPSWSPDGNEIVYLENSAQGSNLWKVNLKTMQRQQLTTKGRHYVPQWSFQGDKIVFTAIYNDTNNDDTLDVDDNIYIYTIDRDGKNIQKITKNPKYRDVNPHWVSDGIHIVFSRRTITGENYKEDGPGEIYIVNTVTGDLRALTFTSISEVVPIPSPSGNQFLLVYWKEDSSQLYLANWDGQTLSEPVFVTDGYGATWRPQPK